MQNIMKRWQMQAGSLNRSFPNIAIEIDNWKAYNRSMKTASIAEFKNRLSEYISKVEQGEEIELCRRNIPIAKVVRIAGRQPNNTRLGCGAGTVKIKGNLTEPLIPLASWNMLGPHKK